MLSFFNASRFPNEHQLCSQASPIEPFAHSSLEEGDEYGAKMMILTGKV